jgi:AraC-like DNA-binding protein
MFVASDLDFSPIPDERWSSYLRVTTTLRDSGLSCRGAGEQAGRWPTMGERRLSTHAIVFVTEGTGRYVDEANPRPVGIAAPAVIWLFPGVAHRYGPVGGGWREHWTLFEGVATRGYEALGMWSRATPVASSIGADFGDRIASEFARLRRVLSIPERRAPAMAAAIVHGLVATAAEATGRGSREAARSVVESLVATAFTRLSVAERAREFGLPNEDALRAAVEEASGMTPHELVIQTRLARAQELLATTSADVGSIARQVGYDDPAYFSRLFSTRVGIPPVEFRRQNAGLVSAPPRR